MRVPPVPRWRVLSGVATGAIILIAGTFLLDRHPSRNASADSATDVGKHGGIAVAPAADVTDAKNSRIPLTDEQKKSAAEADEYFAANLGRLHALISEECPRLMAERDAKAPHIEQAIAFGSEFRRSFLGEHELHARRYDEARRSVWGTLSKLAPREAQLATVEIYLRALSETGKIGDRSAGQIVRELLFDTHHIEDVKRSLAQIEKEVFEDGRTANRIEEIKTGEQLIAMLEELAPRHENARRQISEQIPLPQELREFSLNLTYANCLQHLMGTYERSWGAALKDAEAEALSIQSIMIRLMNQVPEGSPERDRLESEYTDVLVALGKRRLELNEKRKLR